MFKLILTSLVLIKILHLLLFTLIEFKKEIIIFIDNYLNYIFCGGFFRNYLR